MKKYPYGIISPFLKADIADGVLGDFFEITEQLKMRACVTHGLCLGFVRDGGYIEGDNDLDVGVTCNEAEKKMLFDSLEYNGFSRGHSYRHNTHFHKNKILVDVHFQELTGFYSIFGRVEYKGRLYPTPSPVEEYLSAYYHNWKIRESESL